jgi:hypothetical protein
MIGSLHEVSVVERVLKAVSRPADHRRGAQRTPPPRSVDAENSLS